MINVLFDHCVLYFLCLAITAAVYFRAALGTAFLSAVTDLIEITNLSERSSPPTEILPHVMPRAFYYIFSPLIKLNSFELFPY